MYNTNNTKDNIVAVLFIILLMAVPVTIAIILGLILRN